jgi:hypothetical protein
MSNRVLLLTVICIVLLMSFALACCCPIAIPWGGGNTGNDTTTPGTATIKGTVVMTTNEGTKPVGNMNITIGDRATTTNDSGFFEITGLAAGTYDVQVTGGDLGWHDTVAVSAGETRDLGNMQLGATLPLP